MLGQNFIPNYEYIEYSIQKYLAFHSIYLSIENHTMLGEYTKYAYQVFSSFLMKNMNTHVFMISNLVIYPLRQLYIIDGRAPCTVILINNISVPYSDK